MVEDNFGPELKAENPQAETAANGSGSSNGNGDAHGKRAGLSQIMVGSEGSDFFELSKELLRIPGDFSELIPRARFTPQQGAAALRALTDEDQYEDGYIDTRKMVFLAAGFSICQDGLAREEALRAHTGGQGWRASLKGAANNFVDRFRSQGNGTAQREGPA